jgi:hypothetical protein
MNRIFLIAACSVAAGYIFLSPENLAPSGQPAPEARTRGLVLSHTRNPADNRASNQASNPTPRPCSSPKSDTQANNTPPRAQTTCQPPHAKQPALNRGGLLRTPF